MIIGMGCPVSVLVTTPFPHPTDAAKGGQVASAQFLAQDAAL
jgi:hypothetical protein